MTRLGNLWTSSVAYLSLLTGAGLSVAGNLADTYRIRGEAVDGVDIVLAVGAPLASLLVAELFVSHWPRRLSVQSLRWFGLTSVGALAMIVSWYHIHALLMARGQGQLVATLWPLAIDGLAIMAMAKILVNRGHVATEEAVATDRETGQLHPVGHVDISGHDHVAKPEDCGQWPEDMVATHPWMPAEDWAKELDELATQDEMAIAQAGRELATEAERVANGQSAVDVPVLPGQLPQRVAKESVPDEAAKLIRDMMTLDGASKAEVDQEVMDRFRKSLRTARRWRSQVTNQPVSGPPSDQDN